MSVTLQQIEQSRKLAKPSKKLITVDQLINEENTQNSINELTGHLQEIVDILKRDYEHEEEKLNEQRAIIMQGLTGLLKNLERGNSAGSFEHIRVSAQIYETIIEMMGLKKPVNKKPEQKVNTNIRLEFHKSRD